MKLTSDRAWRKPDYTISRFYVSGRRFNEVLEDTDRGLDQSMPVGMINQIKVYGKTAIPRGTYKVILSVSPKFKDRSWAKKWGGRTPEILNVKGFSGVRIHPGNTAEDSLGCLIVGENKKVGKVINSTKCFDALMKVLVPAFESGEEITLEIK